MIKYIIVDDEHIAHDIVKNYCDLLSNFERSVKAVHKVNNKTKNDVLPSLSENKSETIFLKSDKKQFQVKLATILFVEAYGNYCKVVTESETITVREKISEFLEKLSKVDFLQVHKSFIIAKKHINIIEGNRIKINSYFVPVGKTYKENLNSLLNQKPDFN